MSSFGKLLERYQQQYDHDHLHLSADVQAFVDALDNHNRSLCPYLDETGITLALKILLQSEPCLAQQRGLYLLEVSPLVLLYLDLKHLPRHPSIMVETRRPVSRH